MNPILVILVYVVVLLFLLEAALRRLYRLAYEIAPEDQRQGCEAFINVRWPWNNQFCKNARLKGFADMCVRIYHASVLLGFILPVFAIFALAAIAR